jgi:PAS domain-containing protein
MGIEFAITNIAVSLWAAALASGMTAYAAWRMRSRSPGGIYFAAMMSAIVFWCLMSGTEAAAVGLRAKILFSSLGYIGICAVVPFYVTFAFKYGSRRRRWTVFSNLAIWTIPVVTLLLTLTNRWHHLIWSSFQSAPSGEPNMILYGHGPWFWVWILYAAAGTVIAQTVLVQSALTGDRLFMRQVSTFLAAAALPWIGEALYLWHGNPLPGFDFPSIGFAAAGIFILIGISRFRLFDIVPIGRIDLVEQMTAGLVVLDPSGRIVDLNSSAHRMLEVDAHAVGKQAEEIFEGVGELLQNAERRGGETTITTSFPGAQPRRLTVTISPINKERHGVVGRILEFREVPISPEANSHGDIVPMCASCRKVRDDSGDWQSLERYVELSLGKRFSHGLCDGCVENLYPELGVDRVASR